jgi:hypothetical protein
MVVRSSGFGRRALLVRDSRLVEPIILEPVEAVCELGYDM